MENGEFDPKVAHTKEEVILRDKEKREAAAIEGPVSERAREILGKDFLGVRAIHGMEDSLEKSGLTVRFDLGSTPPIPFHEKDLEIAKQRGEMLVLRPLAYKFLRNGMETWFVLEEFMKLFRKDPRGEQQYLFDAFREYGWKGLEGANLLGDMTPGWAFVKKDVLEGSAGKPWREQKRLLRQYEVDLEKDGAEATDVDRRSVMETVWDTMLYYVNTGEHLLERVYDWGKTKPQTFRVVGGASYAGQFSGKYGLDIFSQLPDEPREDLGVCPTRR